MMHTLDLLAPFKHAVGCNIRSVADQCVPASVMYSAFNGWIVLNDIYRQSCALGKRPELIIDGLDLYGVQRNESGLASTLVAHILKAQVLVECLNDNKTS